MRRSSPKNVLEIGTGTGRVTKALAEFQNVDSFEIVESMYLEAKEQLEEHDNVTLYLGDFTKYKFSKTYDVVIFPFHILQEVHSSKQLNLMFKKTHEVLTDNGYVIIDLINSHLSNFPKDGLLKIQHLKTILDGEDISIYLTPQENITKSSLELIRYFKFEESKKVMVEKIKRNLISVELIDTLAQMNNMKIDMLFGDFKKNEYTKLSPKILTILRKSDVA